MSTAIAGVSPQKDAAITTVWPSISATFFGRLIGSLCGCVPLKINGVPISCLLFGLPLAPLGALLYLGGKVAGPRYRLTRGTVQVWAALGNKLIKSVALSDIAEIRMTQQGGQEFFKAADMELISAEGGILLRMPGISYPEVFRQTIEETRQASMLTAASLETIRKRAK